MRSYSRERLSGWVIHALEESGQVHAATDLCVAEARSAGSYQRAVDRLIALDRFADAQAIAEEGLKNTNPQLAGLIKCLQDSIAKLAQKNNDHSVAAAIAANRFVERPSIGSLEELFKAARNANCEKLVQEIAMAYLETGIAPQFDEKRKTTSRKKSSRKKSSQGETKKKTTNDTASKSKSKKRNPMIQVWPFPIPSATHHQMQRVDRPQVKSIPHFDVLIRLAIKQKDAKSVLNWYDALLSSTANKGRYRFYHFEREVAAAIAREYPDRAIEIYGTEADNIAAQTNTKSYPQAIAMLKEARKILKHEKRAHEFQVILETFHQTHRRKRRLVELLNGLAGKPIVSKKSFQ